MAKSLVKSKTFWAAIVQWLLVIVGSISGNISLGTLIADTVAMVFVVFLRLDMDSNLGDLLNGYFEKVDWLKDGVFWTVVAGVLGSVAGWLTGMIDLTTMLIAVVTALIGFFLRSGATPE